MEALTELACKTANKVSLNMLYGETAGHREHAGQMTEEAFAATSDLLELVNPTELREWFEQFHRIFSRKRSRLIEDPVAWSQFVTKQCDSLHEIGLHQKTIASVGTELARWDRQSVSYKEFGAALNGLACLITEYAAQFSRSIDQQSGRVSNQPRRTLAFSHAVCGLTFVLMAIEQAIEIGDPRDEDCAAIATFGANLTISNVNLLYRNCNITTS